MATPSSRSRFSKARLEATSSAAATASEEEEKVCCQIREHLEAVALIHSRTNLVYTSQCGHATYCKPKKCWKIQHVEHVPGQSNGKQTLVAELHYDGDDDNGNNDTSSRRARPLPPVELVESLLMSQELKSWVSQCLEALEGTPGAEERRDEKIAKIDNLGFVDQFGEVINFAVFLSMMHREEDGEKLLSRVLGQKDHPGLWIAKEHNGWIVHPYGNGEIQSVANLTFDSSASEVEVESEVPSPASNSTITSILENLGLDNKRAATYSQQQTSRPKRAKIESSHRLGEDSLLSLSHTAPARATQPGRPHSGDTIPLLASAEVKKEKPAGTKSVAGRPPALESSSVSDHATDDEGKEELEKQATGSFMLPATNFKAAAEGDIASSPNVTSPEVVTGSSSFSLEGAPTYQEQQVGEEDEEQPPVCRSAAAEGSQDTAYASSSQGTSSFRDREDAGDNMQEPRSSPKSSNTAAKPMKNRPPETTNGADAPKAAFERTLLSSRGSSSHKEQIDGTGGKKAIVPSLLDNSSCEEGPKGRESEMESRVGPTVVTPLHSSPCDDETKEGGQREQVAVAPALTEGTSCEPSSEHTRACLSLHNLSPSDDLGDKGQKQTHPSSKNLQAASTVRVEEGNRKPIDQPKVAISAEPCASRRLRANGSNDKQPDGNKEKAENREEGGKATKSNGQGILNLTSDKGDRYHEAATEGGQKGKQFIKKELTPCHVATRSARSGIQRSKPTDEIQPDVDLASERKIPLRRSKRPHRGLDDDLARPEDIVTDRRSLRQRNPTVRFAEEENKELPNERGLEDSPRRATRLRGGSGHSAENEILERMHPPPSEKDKDSSGKSTKQRRRKTSFEPETEDALPPPVSQDNNESPEQATRARRSRVPVERYTDARSEKLEEMLAPASEAKASSRSAPCRVRSRRLNSRMERYTNATAGDLRTSLVRISVHGEESMDLLQAVMTSEGIPKEHEGEPGTEPSLSTTTYSLRARKTRTYNEDDSVSPIDEPGRESAEMSLDETDEDETPILIRTPFVLNRKNFLRAENLVKHYEDVYFKRHETCFSLRGVKDISAESSVESLTKELEVLDKKYPMDEEEEDIDFTLEQQLHNKTLRVMQGRRSQEQSMRMKEKEQAEHISNQMLQEQWISKKKALSLEALEWEQIVNRPIQFAEARTMRGKRIWGKESCPTLLRRDRDEKPAFCRLCEGTATDTMTPVKGMMPLFRVVDTDDPEFLERDDDIMKSSEERESEKKASRGSKRMKFDPRRRRETARKLGEVRHSMDFIEQYNYGLLQKVTTGP